MRVWDGILALVLVLLLTGCVKKTNPADVDCGVYTDRKIRSDCLYNKSIALMNPTSCKDINDANVRAACITDIAIRLGDDYYCVSQDRLPLKEDCERKVADAQRAAKAKSNPTP